MSALDWYGEEGSAEGDSVGLFPEPGEPIAVVGGPCDGERVPWEIRGAIEVVHEDKHLIRTYYYPCRWVHAPQPGAEGPIGIELVWMTHAAYTHAPKARRITC